MELLADRPRAVHGFGDRMEFARDTREVIQAIERFMADNRLIGNGLREQVDGKVRKFLSR
jgi:hypothetical protein